MRKMGADDLQANLDLINWRRRVADLYRVGTRDGLEAFRKERDRLFATHPQSPLPAADRAAFEGIDYFSHDPSLLVRCELEAMRTTGEIEIDTGGPDGVIHYRRAARAHFQLEGVSCSLTIFSLVGYGGGLFLPFRDATSGKQTYGGGRYLFDSIKNHLPMPAPVVGELLVELDFNYAYNPSCAYNHLWACPLAPTENWLSVAVDAGEKAYTPPRR